MATRNSTALKQTRGKRAKKALYSLDHLLAKMRIDLGYDRKGGYPSDVKDVHCFGKFVPAYYHPGDGKVLVYHPKTKCWTRNHDLDQRQCYEVRFAHAKWAARKIIEEFFASNREAVSKAEAGKAIEKFFASLV